MTPLLVGGEPVYALQVRSLTATQLPNLWLQLGGGGARLRIRAQGDTFYFANPESGGISLALMSWPGVPDGTVLQRQVYVEVLVAFGPDIQFPPIDADPWRLCPWYAKSVELTPTAGNLAVIRLMNLFGDLVTAKVRRLLLWSATPGRLYCGFSTALAGQFSANPLHLDQQWSTVGLSACGTSSASAAAVEGGELFRPDVESARPLDLDRLDIELPEHPTAGQQHNLTVCGLVDTTLRVTFFWQERLHPGAGVQ